MPQLDGRPAIALVGAGACDDHQRDAARLVGRPIAENGALLMCGGDALGAVREALRLAREPNG